MKWQHYFQMSQKQNLKPLDGFSQYSKILTGNILRGTCSDERMAWVNIFIGVNSVTQFMQIQIIITL